MYDDQKAVVCVVDFFVILVVIYISALYVKRLQPKMPSYSWL